MTTLNIRALQVLEGKIKKRLEQIKEEAFDSSEFSDFKKYVGVRDGLILALGDIAEVEKELNS